MNAKELQMVCLMLNRCWTKAKWLISLCLLLIVLMQVGCVETPISQLPESIKLDYYKQHSLELTPSYEIAEHYPNITEDDDFAFFGTWRLVAHAFSIETIDSSIYQDGNLSLPRYALDHDIKNFIGYEIEFRADFVRLGDTDLRVLYIVSIPVQMRQILELQSTTLHFQLSLMTFPACLIITR